MGLVIRRRKRIARNAWVNASKSGVSVSARAGRLTVNSRGRVSLRIAPGVYIRL